MENGTRPKKLECSNGSKYSCNSEFLVSDLVSNISTKIGHNFRKILGLHRKYEFYLNIMTTIIIKYSQSFPIMLFSTKVNVTLGKYWLYDYLKLRSGWSKQDLLKCFSGFGLKISQSSNFRSSMVFQM